MAILTDLIGWAHLLVQLAGLGVAAFHVGRTKWAWLLASGFGAGAVVSLFYRIVTFATRSGAMSYEKMGALFGVASLGGLAADALVIVGVAGLLAEQAKAGDRDARI